MRRDKEGFSLVELMIALAMTAIVMLIVIGLMGFGVRNLTLTRAEVSLQQEAEDAAKHMTSYAMEGSRIYLDTADKKLQIDKDTVDPTGAVTATESWLYWQVDDKIYFGKIGTDPGVDPIASPAPSAGPSSAPSEAPSSSPSEAPSIAPSTLPSVNPSALPSAGPSSIEDYLLAEHVKSFNCEVITDDITKKKAVKVTVNMEGSESTFDYHKQVFLRNQEVIYYSDEEVTPTSTPTPVTP